MNGIWMVPLLICMAKLVNMFWQIRAGIVGEWNRGRRHERLNVVENECSLTRGDKTSFFSFRLRLTNLVFNFGSFLVFLPLILCSLLSYSPLTIHSFCFPRISDFAFKMASYSHSDRLFGNANWRSFLDPARIQKLICEGKDLFEMVSVQKERASLKRLAPYSSLTRNVYSILSTASRSLYLVRATRSMEWSSEDSLWSLSSESCGCQSYSIQVFASGWLCEGFVVIRDSFCSVWFLSISCIIDLCIDGNAWLAPEERQERS